MFEELNEEELKLGLDFLNELTEQEKIAQLGWFSGSKKYKDSLKKQIVLEKMKLGLMKEIQYNLRRAKGFMF